VFTESLPSNGSTSHNIIRLHFLAKDEGQLTLWSTDLEKSIAAPLHGLHKSPTGEKEKKAKKYKT
jgi:hypothetical protein